MSTLNLERMLRLHWMWQAGAPAVSSADRGRAAQPGPGTMRMLDRGHSSVSPWRGMDTLHMTPMWCPEAVIVKQVHSNHARLDIIDLHGCASWSRELHFWSISGLWSICGNLKIMQSLIHNPCDRKYISSILHLENSATTASPPNNVCNVAPEDRTECGYAGIGEAGCSQRGCCYDNSIPDTFLCFFKTGDELTQKLTKK